MTPMTWCKNLRIMFDLPGLIVNRNLATIIRMRESSDATMGAWLHPEITRICRDVAQCMKPLSSAQYGTVRDPKVL